MNANTDIQQFLNHFQKADNLSFIQLGLNVEHTPIGQQHTIQLHTNKYTVLSNMNLNIKALDADDQLLDYLEDIQRFNQLIEQKKKNNYHWVDELYDAYINADEPEQLLFGDHCEENTLKVINHYLNSVN